MKRRLVPLLLLMVGVSPSGAHEGAGAQDHGGVHAHATEQGCSVEASAIVTGRVAALKGILYRLDQWPEVFSDTHCLRRRTDDVWSVDFARFGLHDFEVTRTPRGVLFNLAGAGEHRARFEYVLEPVDAGRSKLTVSLSVTTPPDLTRDQTLAQLRAKVLADVQDFVARAAR